MSGEPDEPRMVEVTIIERRDVTIPEPDWCVDPHNRSHDFADLSHHGPEVTAQFETPRGMVRYLSAWFTQAPYLVTNPELVPMLAVELDGDCVSMTPEAVRAFTRITRAHLDVLDALADDLARLRGEDSQ
ncbi:DUF6907 domain-containing protein [Streptomyces sp. NPDC058108]|uniref:DUF6907 domain-containing protein n=1 Tax=Streptomyces sp. NPDC058108 TaxID=3346344 RepID=UPI0036E4B92B